MSDERPPPPLLSALFWACLAFGAAMILLGAAVGLLGPSWLSRRAHALEPLALTQPMVRGRGAGRIPDHP